MQGQHTFLTRTGQLVSKKGFTNPDKCSSLEEARKTAPGATVYIKAPDGCTYFAETGSKPWNFRLNPKEICSKGIVDRTLAMYELARIRDPGMFDGTLIQWLARGLYYARWFWRYR
jgi:hypothetical protein